MFDDVADGAKVWLRLRKVAVIPSQTLRTPRPAVFSLHVFCSACGCWYSTSIPPLVVDLTICVGKVCHQRGGYAIDRAVFRNRRRSIVLRACNKFPLPRQLRN